MVRAVWRAASYAPPPGSGHRTECPLDLHTLLPVPGAILALGATHPEALGWLAAHSNGPSRSVLLVRTPPLCARRQERYSTRDAGTTVGASRATACCAVHRWSCRYCARISARRLRAIGSRARAGPGGIVGLARHDRVFAAELDHLTTTAMRRAGEAWASRSWVSTYRHGKLTLVSPPTSRRRARQAGRSRAILMHLLYGAEDTSRITTAMSPRRRLPDARQRRCTTRRGAAEPSLSSWYKYIGEGT
jgi:hypothetical protein